MTDRNEVYITKQLYNKLYIENLSKEDWFELLDKYYKDGIFEEKDGKLNYQIEFKVSTIHSMHFFISNDKSVGLSKYDLYERLSFYNIDNKETYFDKVINVVGDCLELTDYHRNIIDEWATLRYKKSKEVDNIFNNILVDKNISYSEKENVLYKYYINGLFIYDGKKEYKESSLEFLIEDCHIFYNTNKDYISIVAESQIWKIKDFETYFESNSKGKKLLVNEHLKEILETFAKNFDYKKVVNKNI